MKPLILAVAFAALFAPPSFALASQEESYLRKIGLDPKSAAVVAAEAEGTITTMYKSDMREFSLSGLIAQGNVPNGVKAFVATRAFIARLKRDFAGTPVPKTNYDPMYLTDEERDLVTDKIIAGV